jgi:hypothetical protein
LSSPALRQSKQLEQRIEHMRRFRRAFKETLALATEEWEDMLGKVTRQPSEANRERYEESLDRLGELAGVALAAAGDVQSSVTRFGHSYYPLLQWRDPFRVGGGLASAREVIDACDTVIGILLTRLEEARANEATIAYKVGRVVGFPQRARLAAGPGRIAKEVAFWGSVAAGVVAGLIVLAIPILLGALARSLL